MQWWRYKKKPKTYLSFKLKKCFDIKVYRRYYGRLYNFMIKLKVNNYCLKLQSTIQIPRNMGIKRMVSERILEFELVYTTPPAQSLIEHTKKDILETLNI